MAPTTLGEVTVPQVGVPTEGQAEAAVGVPAPPVAGETAEAPSAPAPNLTGTIALPTAAEPASDDTAPPAAPQTVVTADPRAEASFPATPAPTAGEAAAPGPSAPARPKVEAETAQTGGKGADDDQAPSDSGRSSEAPVRSLDTPAPTFAPTRVAAPAGPSANVVFSTPGAPAPSPTAALEATLRMAGERGFTRARVTLRPAELGGVEVFLRQGSAGLTATVVAETPHAAQLLESSAAELQRRLSAQGLELSSLQISVGGESAGAAHGGRDGQGAAASTAGGARGAAEPDAGAEQSQTIDLGGGVLVDVLA